MRGFNHTYDGENLYHSIEYAQYDSLQLGMYIDANKYLMRIEDAVSNQITAHEGRLESWKKAEGRAWEQYRMYARQLIETYNTAPYFTRYSMPDAYLCLYANHENDSSDGQSVRHTECQPDAGSISDKTRLNFPHSVLRNDLPDGRMNYAALSESGATLVTGLSAAKSYAGQKGVNGTEGMILKMCIDRLDQLSKDLKERKGTMNYVKHAVKMFQEILLGIKDLAEEVKPHGFQCYNKKSCPIMKDKKSFERIRKQVLKGHLRTATNIQRNDMVQSPATPTLLFMPSYEIYGHVLLLLDLNWKAKHMFENSLLERMGRVQSIVGLARAHAMVGNIKEATYFYTYLKNQLKNADDYNPFVAEANSWYNSDGNSTILQGQWHWPYL